MIEKLWVPIVSPDVEKRRLLPVLDTLRMLPSSVTWYDAFDCPYTYMPVPRPQLSESLEKSEWNEYHRTTMRPMQLDATLYGRSPRKANLPWPEQIATRNTRSPRTCPPAELLVRLWPECHLRHCELKYASKPICNPP